MISVKIMIRMIEWSSWWSRSSGRSRSSRGWSGSGWWSAAFPRWLVLAEAWSQVAQGTRPTTSIYYLLTIFITSIKIIIAWKWKSYWATFGEEKDIWANCLEKKRATFGEVEKYMCKLFEENIFGQILVNWKTQVQIFWATLGETLEEALFWQLQMLSWLSTPGFLTAPVFVELSILCLFCPKLVGA